MNQNRFPLYAGLIAFIALLAYSSIFVVRAGQQAIVLRFGQIVDVKADPGIYFKLPFGFLEADNVQMIEDRLLSFELDNIRVQVSGGKFYEVDAFLVYQITDPRKFRQTVSGDVTLAEARLRTRLDASLRGVYGLRGFEAALSDERAGMMNEVREQLRPDAEISRTADHRRAHSPDGPDAGGVATDVRPHEGRTSCRGRTLARPWP